MKIILCSILAAFAILLFLITLTFAERFFYEYRVYSLADRISNQGGIGRNCGSVQDYELKSLVKNYDVNVSELSSKINCLDDISLKVMEYVVDHDVVTGVYRCERNEYIQELRITMYLTDSTIPQDYDCQMATLKKEWNLEPGEATTYSKP
ncbi:hypothetical protein NF212_19010 [Parasalinivibrio latis]|uniref:hypothetical protein n=1 Tax=Parasalinivibrio latis TaxID=2952610 RepID=UPI0030E1A946